MNQRTGSLLTAASTTGASVFAAAQQLGFWGSIIIPMTYIPVLYGTSGSEQLPVLLGLLALNVCCLVAGHGYSR